MLRPFAYTPHVAVAGTPAPLESNPRRRKRRTTASFWRPSSFAICPAGMPVAASSISVS